jgi:polyhydroxyalkanoate synthase
MAGTAAATIRGPLAKEATMVTKRKAARAGAAPAAAKVSRKPRAAAAPPDERLQDSAARNTLAVNPLIGIRASDFGGAAQALVGAAVRQPVKAARHLGAYAKELAKAVRGKSDAAPDPKDKRFADPAWASSPVHRRLLQAHLATGRELERYIESTSLNARDKARAHLVASIFVDAIAPSNTLLNPTALKRAVDTGGTSLIAGAKNLVHDLRHNKGLPASVDTSAFELGRNIATTPGRVVHKDEVLELIQYQPTTKEVHARPLVITPPQVNKFYALDLSPEKSLIRFAVGSGLQVFAISWRNPTKTHRDWDMSTYVRALDDAVNAARQISGSADVNLWGACSGGMTAAAYLGWLAATGQPKVKSVISPVCLLDPTQSMDTTLGLLASDQGLKALKAGVKRRGVVDGAELARVFAWLRPNDLIWNYWVNNYLLGNKPPAFDILYWNADTTRLPAAFHADLIDVFLKNPYVNAGEMTVLGEPVDMGRVQVDAYIVAGITDHITPWKACYQTARIYGPGSDFVLANAGHLQSLLNPPGSAKSFFFHSKVGGPDPDAWAAGATRHDGSWWPHWLEWMRQRSGEARPAPRRLGSRKHAPGAAAPGAYVFEP